MATLSDLKRIAEELRCATEDLDALNELVIDPIHQRRSAAARDRLTIANKVIQRVIAEHRQRQDSAEAAEAAA